MAPLLVTWQERESGKEKWKNVYKEFSNGQLWSVCSELSLPLFP